MMPASDKLSVKTLKVIDCEPEEYPAIRKALEDRAEHWKQSALPIRAAVALAEIRRLDRLFNYPPSKHFL